MSSTEVAMQNITEIDDEWDPMRAEYEDPKTNRYICGPGSHMDVLLQRPMQRNKDDMPVFKLFATQIPSNLKEVGLKNAFSNFGRAVVRANINALTGHVKFAHIDYPTLKEAQAAIEGLNRRPPLNLIVKFALSPEEKNRRKLQEEKEKMQLEKFSEFSKQMDVHGKSNVKPISNMRVLGRGIARGTLVVKVVREHNNRRPGIRQCVWTDGAPDIRDPGQIMYDPTSVNHESYNRFKQNSIVITTSAFTNSVRKVSMGRAYIPRNDGQNENNDCITSNNNVVHELGRDVNVPVQPCLVCQKETVLKCYKCGAAYCSKKCQNHDFERHKAKCSPRSIDVFVDATSQRTVKFDTLCQEMDTTELQLPAPDLKNKMELHRTECNALDLLNPGMKPILLVESIHPSVILGALCHEKVKEPAEKLAITLPRLMEKMPIDQSFRPIKGDLVCVKYDGSFWRGYILSKSQGTADVALCDLGKVVTVNLESTSILRLPNEFRSLPELSVKCNLVRSRLPGGQVELLNKLQEVYKPNKIPKGQFNLEIESDDDFVLFGKLFVNQVAVADISLEPWEPMLSELNVVPFKPPCKVILSSYHNQHALYLRPIGKTYQEQFFSILQQVALVHVNSPPLLRAPRKGEMVACLYKEDGNYYRGVVISESPETQGQYRISFIDFGNLADVPLEHLKELPDSLKGLSCLAFKVCLKDVPPRPLTEEAVQFLNNLLEQEKELRLECPPSNLGVDLFMSDDNTSVNGKLRDFLQPDWMNSVQKGDDPHRGKVYLFENFPVLPLLPDGKDVGNTYVYVSHVLPEGRLAVCPVDKPEVEHVLQTLSAQINEYCEAMGPSTVYSPRDHEMCLAKFSGDSLWYRAVNLRTVSCYTCEVLYLDFGNIEIVHFSCIRRMVDDFIRIPTLISFCSIEGLPENPTEDMTQRVKDMIQLKTVYEVEILRTNEPGDYNIRIPQVSNQLNSERNA